MKRKKIVPKICSLIFLAAFSIKSTAKAESAPTQQNKVEDKKVCVYAQNTDAEREENKSVRTIKVDDLKKSLEVNPGKISLSLGKDVLMQKEDKLSIMGNGKFRPLEVFSSKSDLARFGLCKLSIPKEKGESSLTKGSELNVTDIQYRSQSLLYFKKEDSMVQDSFRFVLNSKNTQDQLYLTCYAIRPRNSEVPKVCFKTSEISLSAFESLNIHQVSEGEDTGYYIPVETLEGDPGAT
jgi:hypothetical protein